jgi:hypothetical protein
MKAYIKEATDSDFQAVLSVVRSTFKASGKAGEVAQ